LVQASFAPLDPVQKLYDLLRERCVVPSCTFQLFTTPPKAVLKPADFTKTFWKAGFVPAANVHLGIVNAEAGGGPILRPEVLAIASTVVVAGPKVQQDTENAGSSGAAENAQAKASSKQPSSGDPKVPKWMKTR
jgi:hypothetical protein